MDRSPFAVLMHSATLILVAVLSFCAIASTQVAYAASDLATYLPKAAPADFFPGSDRFGPPQGDPPLVPVYRGDQLQGFIYLNSDFANAVGYSGKPIHILVGIDPKGVITGLKLVDHKEPIVLVGIPEARIVAALNALIGKDMRPVAQGAEHPPQVDIVSGATVTVLVMSDSIVRSAVRLIRTGRVGGDNAATAPCHLSPRPSTFNTARFTIGRVWSATVRSGGCV